MELSSTINISIPNLESQEGNIFSTSIDIISNTYGIFNQTDLSDYTLLMEATNQS